MFVRLGCFLQEHSIHRFLQEFAVNDKGVMLWGSSWAVCITPNEGSFSFEDTDRCWVGALVRSGRAGLDAVLKHTLEIRFELNTNRDWWDEREVNEQNFGYFVLRSTSRSMMLSFLLFVKHRERVAVLSVVAPHDSIDDAQAGLEEALRQDERPQSQENVEMTFEALITSAAQHRRSASAPAELVHVLDDRSYTLPSEL